MINFFFEFSNYQTSLKAYINTPYKRNKNFQRFWKKKFKWKEKSQYYRIQDYAMQTKIKICMQKNFLRKKFCLRTKFDSRLKKNFVGKFSKVLEKKFVSLSQNASHTISIYGNCMESIFSKNIIISFFVTSLFKYFHNAGEVV